MTVSKGFYRHYKGHIYYVHGVACLKHEQNRRVVIYTSVKTEQEKIFDFLARDEIDFEEMVEPDTGKAWGGSRVSAVLAVRRFARITDPEQSIVSR